MDLYFPRVVEKPLTRIREGKPGVGKSNGKELKHTRAEITFPENVCDREMLRIVPEYPEMMWNDVEEDVEKRGI